jgi:hypothetical protein
LQAEAEDHAKFVVTGSVSAYLSLAMKINPLPAGFVVPAQPVKAPKPPVGTDWFMKSNMTATELSSAGTAPQYGFTAATPMTGRRDWRRSRLPLSGSKPRPSRLTARRLYEGIAASPDGEVKRLPGSDGGRRSLHVAVKAATAA